MTLELALPRGGVPALGILGQPSFNYPPPQTGLPVDVRRRICEKRSLASPFRPDPHGSLDPSGAPCTRTSPAPRCVEMDLMAEVPPDCADPDAQQRVHFLDYDLTYRNDKRGEKLAKQVRPAGRWRLPRLVAPKPEGA